MRLRYVSIELADLLQSRLEAEQPGEPASGRVEFVRLDASPDVEQASDDDATTDKRDATAEL